MEPKTPEDPPTDPRRVVITAGMPYGNKDLHFAHIGAVFIHADFYARFMRDRIGPENVVFVSGTDCYGSPIVESWRSAVEAGQFEGSLEDFVRKHHEQQVETLRAFDIALDLYGASGLGRTAEIHEDISNFIFEALKAKGRLVEVELPQFYDEKAGVFLNGRQVVGRCPFRGCSADKAYADECALGHQYRPEDLIAPVSTLTGEKPSLRPVANWCIDLERVREDLARWTTEHMARQPEHRDFVTSIIEEFLSPPILHVLKTFTEAYEGVRDRLPAHERTEESKKGKSFSLVFETLADRDRASAILAEADIRYRASKYLVPFRLTGNVPWGVPVRSEAERGLTFWVWPESLWAPISFTAAHEEKTRGSTEGWKDWWYSRDTKIVQFIGEDNIYFYGIGQFAIFTGLQDGTPILPPPDGELQLTTLVANKHLLFLDKKASSSGAVKPPMARELLDYYTADQIRAHFLGLGMGKKSISFRPRPFDPNPKPGEADPALKEGNLLSNVLNKAARSCFYTIQNFFDGRLPVGEVGAEAREACAEVTREFERHVLAGRYYQAMDRADVFIRGITKAWNRGVKAAEAAGDEAIRRQTVIDCLHMVRVAMVLMHPVAPAGTEMFRRYLNVDERFWRWEHLEEPVYFFMANPETHELVTLEPRVDFFPKHPSQFAK